MTTPAVLLLLIGILGAIDIAYFHTWRGRLVLRPECRREAWIHVARGFCYAVQFVFISSLKPTGAWYAAVTVLFIVDASIAVADVLEEPTSRAQQGGLSGGEYLMHIVLSVLVGAYLYAVFTKTAAWALEPTGIRVHTNLPDWLRMGCTIAAIGSATTGMVEAHILRGRCRLQFSYSLRDKAPVPNDM
jgi:hypothetical protein